MAKKTRLSPNKLAKEKESFANLKAITGYSPARAEYEVAVIQPIVDAGDSLRVLEAQKKAELADIRDQIAAKDSEFVEKNDGAALQVAAQYGEDSPEYQSLGRKRKSERRTRRPSNTGGNTPNG